MVNSKPTTRHAHIPLSLALSLTILCIGISSQALSLQAQKTSGTTLPSKRMADGKQWMTQNLDVATPSSYCYEGAEANCRQYGPLYTWEAAASMSIVGRRMAAADRR